MSWPPLFTVVRNNAESLFGWQSELVLEITDGTTEIPVQDVVQEGRK